MKDKRSLPLPFLILILAGIASLFTVIADRATPARPAQDNSLQMQTVEQERMAELYFRVLSWVSDLKAQPIHPAKAAPQPAAVPKVVSVPRERRRLGRVEYCAFPATEKTAGALPVKACLN